MDAAPGLHIIWRQRYALLAFAIIAAASAYAFSTRLPEHYDATALALVVTRDQAGGGALNSDQLLQVSNTFVQLARTDRVLRLTTRELRRARYTRASGEDLEVTAAGQPGVIKFSASAREGRTAAAMANTYARAFAAFIRRQEEARRRFTAGRIERQAAAVERRLALARGTRAAALRSELQTLHSRAADVAIAPADSLRVIERAAVPTKPAAPKPLRNALITLLVALVLWVTVAYARASLRDRYESGEEAAADLGLALLGQLPASGSRRSGELEAVRELRTKVEFALSRRGRARGEHPDEGVIERTALRVDGGPPRNGRVVLVTSAERRSGRSHVTTALARAFAAEGRRVVAVEGDLRRPALSERLHVGAGHGIGDLSRIDNPDRLEGLVKPVTLTTAHGSKLPPRPASPASADSGRLETITAGSRVADPVETLASDSMADTVGALRHTHDLLIIDSPPAAGLADVLVLSRYADGVLLVVDARRTRRRDARDAVATLRAVDAPIIGIVFNRAQLDRRLRSHAGRSVDSPGAV